MGDINPQKLPGKQKKSLVQEYAKGGIVGSNLDKLVKAERSAKRLGK